MKIGITMITTDRAMRPDELAIATEERGFYSLWVPEHTHIPTSRLTPAPTGEPLDPWYTQMLDPYVALTAAAVVTTTLQIGTGVALIAQHHPLTLAKEIASLDLLSGGRFNLGLGFGWNREEMADHGVDFATRRDRTLEHLDAMRAVWGNDEAEFHGTFVDFPPTWSWPKCRVHHDARAAGPSTLIGGGAGPKLFDAVVRHADGWIPVGGAGLADSIGALHRTAEIAGRDPKELRIVPFGSLPSREKLDHFASLGITEVVLRVPSAPADDVLAVLDEFTAYL